jgi:hypothetical protein
VSAALRLAHRRWYLAATAATVAVGLLVFRGGGRLPPGVRDGAGDALWAAMMFWGVSAGAPQGRPGARAAAALALAWTVELAQLVRLPWLVALRATTLGHLVLGSDFDARDLATYALGVGAAALAEWGVRRRRGRRRATARGA